MRRTSHPFALVIIVLGVLMMMLAPANAQELIPLPVVIETSTAPDPQPGEPTPTAIAPEETATVEVPTEEPTPDATPTSDDEISLPPVPTDETPAPPTPTPLPTEGVIFYDDFETDLSKWVTAQDVLIVLDDTGNRVASLPAGASLQPFNFPSLSAFELSVWFSPAANGGLNLQFADGYTLMLASDAPAALIAADGTTLATGETALAADTWRLAELLVQGSDIELLIDGTPQLVYAADTRQAAGQIVLTGSGAGASIDDVSIAIPGEDETEPSPTPSATPTPGEPVTLEMNRTKLDGVLLNVLDVYATGDSGLAFGTASTFMLQVDRQSRISVTLWAAEGFSGQQVANQVEKVNGIVEVTEAKFVRARVPLDGLAALSLKDQVSVIFAAERLASTDVPMGRGAVNLTTRLDSALATIGNEGTEGFNVVGAQAWHQAGFTGDALGTAVSIGVIDIGFGTAENVENNTDLTCLRSFPNVSLVTGSIETGDTRRGRDMVEVICDIAPNSKVRLYKVKNTSQLASAIDSAANNNRIVVIGVDLGVNASPGDGTLGRVDVALDPYVKITEARQDGVIVIASAGNNGTGSVAFTYTSGSTSMQIKVAPGEAVNLGWNDWETSPNGGGTAEDFNAQLSGGVTGSKTARGSSNPGYQFNIPTTCSVDGNGLCTTTLTISSPASGSNPMLIQVQATGLKSTITNPTGGTITLHPNAGNIGRPGDSPEAITVGAVCSYSDLNYPAMDYSSRGPVYTAGGNFTALPATPFKGFNVKPDVVGPAQVSVRNAPINNAGNWCDVGFGGSEAAAAHVAGMAALLLNNETLTQFIGSGAQQAMKSYLRTHSADLYATTPDGYDMKFGAGLTTLGAPDFNSNTLPASSTFITPNRLPTGQTCASYLYVGPYDIGSVNMDGTAIHPFTSPAYAIQAASAAPNGCVVLLPGEYVTPLRIAGLTNPVKVYGYSSVVRVSTPSSRFHVQNGYYTDILSGGVPIGHYGGIYVDNTPGVVINGFTFTTGLVAANTTNAFNYPQVFVASGANNAKFSNNRVQNIFSRTTLVEVIGSNGVEINGNIFRENSSDESLFGSSMISVEDAGGAGNPVEVYENTFRDNVSVQGSWFINGLPVLPGAEPSVRWVSVVKSLDSYIDITNNIFRNNQSETLIQIATRGKGEDYVSPAGDDAPSVARILGNVIVGNTMTTEDVIEQDGQPVGLNSGPIINLWHAQKTYVVNNTIARNSFAANNFRRLIVGRGNDNEIGSPDQLNGSLGSTKNAIELVNNFIFDNDSSGLFDDTTLNTVGCRALVSETDAKGARGNWFFKSGPAAACNSSINDVANNNISNLDPWPVDENGVPTGGPTYIVGGEDPTNPGFYVLTGGPSNPDGVDEGLNTFVQTNMLDFFNGRDVRRATRVRDGDTPPNGSAVIDIGAYETTPLTIVNPIDVPTAQEDSGIITFEFNNEGGSFIEGGVPPFSFDITRYPKFFGTHCDARFTFAARGIVIEELDSGLIVASYCPPRDFHTESTHPFFNIADVSFDVDVIDSTNSAVATVANYTIDQVNDTNHVTALSTEASVAIGRPQTAPQNQVKLRPYVDFTNNFLFSERNSGTGTSATEVDYDFVYSFPTAPGTPPLEAAMEWVNEDAGIIGFDLQAISTEQDTTFTYNVTDRRGNTTPHTITIHAVTEPGNFVLLTPVNNSIVLDVEELKEFTWEFAAPVEFYDFSVEREVDTDFFEPVFSLTDLPEDAFCAAGECALPVNDELLVLLTKGRYRWNVEANNQGLRKPANQPFIFNVIGGRELLKNGSFEEKGKTAKQAKYWRVPQIVTGDRRYTQTGKGADGNSWYRLTAQTTSSGNIKQNAKPIGAPGDLLTLSAFYKTQALKSVTYIQSQITYTNGKKVNIRLTIPKGNKTTYTPLAKTIELKGIVSKNIVTIQQNKGTGRADVDLVSLILDQKLDFKLISPTDNAVFVAPGMINTFTWDESGSAKLYDVTITDLGSTTDVVVETDLTKKKDADRLTCNKDLCRYTLAAPLAEGRYEWSVTASTGFTALNAPFSFEIDLTPTELLKNPGFENQVTGQPKQPLGWKRVKVGVNDARVCNVIPAAFNKLDTIRSYQGNCAFKFVGRPNAQVRLEQKPDGSAFQVDDQLILSFVAKAAGLKANAGRVILTVTYTGGEKEILKEVLPAGKYEWESFEKVLNVANTVQSMNLQIIHSGAAGGYTIDNISVTRLGG